MKELWQIPEVVDDVMVELTRKKSAAELTRMASKAFAATRDRIKRHLAKLHPDWTDTQLKEELIRRIHGSR
jgi:hypothetical protein